MISESRGSRFEQARAIVSELLDHLNADYHYHCKNHTLGDVVPFAHKLCELEQVSEEEAELVLVASLFHDTGFLQQYSANEPMGCQNARTHLVSCGYTLDEIERVCDLIMATVCPSGPGSQTPGHDRLRRILCDADLATLALPSHLARAEALRLEINAVGAANGRQPVSVRSFFEAQVAVYRRHKYFTQSARKLLGPGLERNRAEVLELLDIIDDEQSPNL
ncbi:hypothetical protein BC830DRAFT_69302 [Chytriomyces sp. MP71]|nr:hypothetical protein BC830DRAFT_69302 [Chytriomyces sp. MP71]